MEEKPKFTQRTKSFFKEVEMEMKKVTWPTKNELYGATSVVGAVTLLLSVLLGIADSVMGHAMHFLLSL